MSLKGHTFLGSTLSEESSSGRPIAIEKCVICFLTWRATGHFASNVFYLIESLALLLTATLFSRHSFPWPLTLYMCALQWSMWSSRLNWWISLFCSKEARILNFTRKMRKFVLAKTSHSSLEGKACPGLDAKSSRLANCLLKLQYVIISEVSSFQLTNIYSSCFHFSLTERSSFTL